MSLFALAGFEFESFKYISKGICIARMKRRERVVQNAWIFAGEAFANEFFKFWNVQIEQFGDEAERENIFALVLSRSADGFDRQAGNRNAEMMIFPFPFFLRLDVVGIEKHDAAFFERSDMVFVGMLVEAEQHIGFVARTQTSPEPMRT